MTKLTQEKAESLKKNTVKEIEIIVPPPKVLASSPGPFSFYKEIFFIFLFFPPQGTEITIF